MQDKYLLNLLLSLCTVILILTSIVMDDYYLMIPAALLYLIQLIEGFYSQTLKTVLQIKSLEEMDDIIENK